MNLENLKKIIKLRTVTIACTSAYMAMKFIWKQWNFIKENKTGQVSCNEAWKTHNRASWNMMNRNSGVWNKIIREYKMSLQLSLSQEVSQKFNPQSGSFFSTFNSIKSINVSVSYLQALTSRILRIWNISSLLSISKNVVKCYCLAYLQLLYFHDSTFV